MRAIAIGNRNELAPPLVNAMHEFRREIFVRKLGWMLPMPDGVERDEYDHSEAVYLVTHEQGERIVASARLLPTTRSYMLPDLFPELLGGAAAPRDPAVWELSRFAVDIKASRDTPLRPVSTPTKELFESVLRFAGSRGIERLSLVTCMAMERLLVREGMRALRIASPADVRGTRYVALYIQVPGPSHYGTALEIH